MSKSRLKRYQSEGNNFPKLPLTGRVLLKYRDDALLQEEPPQPGDVRFYLHDDNNGAGRLRGDYTGLGHAGYLKAEVHDGREWRLLVMDEIFSDRIHHFSKKERPIDTYALCEPRMVELKGALLQRIYREHYELFSE